MAKKKRKTEAIVKRVVEPAVRVVKSARTKLSRGGPKMTGKQIAAGIIGTVGSGALTYGLGKVGLSPTVTTLGITGIGGVGAFMLEGVGQAAAAGAAAGGLLMAINKALVEHDVKKALEEQAKHVAAQQVAAQQAAVQQMNAQPPVQPVPPPKRQAAMSPGEVQAAFDAARTHLYRPAGPAYWPQA